jgi:hypothetical protein
LSTCLPKSHSECAVSNVRPLVITVGLKVWFTPMLMMGRFPG